MDISLRPKRCFVCTEQSSVNCIIWSTYHTIYEAVCIRLKSRFGSFAAGPQPSFVSLSNREIRHSEDSNEKILAVPGAVLD